MHHLYFFNVINFTCCKKNCQLASIETLCSTLHLLLLFHWINEFTDCKAHFHFLLWRTIDRQASFIGTSQWSYQFTITLLRHLRIRAKTYPLNPHSHLPIGNRWCNDFPFVFSSSITTMYNKITNKNNKFTISEWKHLEWDSRDSRANTDRSESVFTFMTYLKREATFRWYQL